MRNEKYTSIAHEHATLLAIIRVAKERFLPMEGVDEPAVRIESEHLPRADSEVPEDTVIEVIMRLQRLAVDREGELKKFNFVKTESTYESAWDEKRTKEPGQQKPPAPGGQGKVKSRKGGSQASGTPVR